jgi:hypothetical protein
MSSDEQLMQDMMQKIQQLKSSDLTSQGTNQAQVPVNNNIPPNQPAGLFDNQGSTTDFANTSVQSGNPVVNANATNPTPAPNNEHGVCPQCNTVHPPVPPGQPCPNASIESQTGMKIDDSEVNKFLVQWRNIVLSNISKNKIEDWKKEFQQITLHIHKYFDNENKEEKIKEEVNAPENPTQKKSKKPWKAKK